MVAITSCNNSTDQQSNSRDSSVATDTGAAQPAPALALTGSLYTLHLSKTDFETLTSTPGTTKLIFQFFFDDKNTKSPTLIAYASRGQNQLINPIKSDTLTAVSAFFDLPQKKVFGDQQILVRDVNAYIQQNTGGSGNYNQLIFVPDIDTNGHIYYKITLDGGQTFAGTLATNPSPPANAN